MALNGVIYGTTNGIRVKAKLEWSSTQDIASNSSTVTAKLYYYKENYGTTATGGSWNGSITIDGERFTGSSGVISLKPGGSAVLAYTAKKVVYHNGDGSKSISISASGALPPSSVTSTDLSGTITLDAIPRGATLLSVPDFNDEENPTITYRNPAGTAVTKLEACISFTGANADIPYRPITETGKSYTFDLTEEERNILRNNTPGNSRSVEFYLKTTIGEKIFYSILSGTLTIVNAQPTLSPIVYDTYQKTVDATGNRDIIVLNASRAYFEIGAASKKGATIVEQGVTVGNNSASVANGTLYDPDSGTFKFYATDSRGNTVYRTIEKQVVPYVPPTARLSVKYAFATENTINITLTMRGKYYNGSFGAKSNALVLEYRYKKDNDAYGEYISGAFNITYGSNNDYTATAKLNGLDYRSLYTFQGAFHDALSQWFITEENKVNAYPVFDWNGRGFNFNVPISMYGNPSDMIVAQGKSGNWNYRKWDSGFAECWGIFPMNGTTSTQWGSSHYGWVLPSQAYPFEFLAPPREYANVHSESYALMLLTQASPNWTYQSRTYSALRMETLSGTSRAYYDIYVFGRWK